jgi:hypothetical protein
LGYTFKKEIGRMRAEEMRMMVEGLRDFDAIHCVVVPFSIDTSLS